MKQPFSKPIEVRLRRDRRTDRGIPSVELVPGQRFLSADEKSEFLFEGNASNEVERIYLTFDDEGNVKQFDWYGRDGDLDGDVQDGTPWQRRSRSIAHLRIGKNPSKKPLRLRIRDLPFPFPAGGSTENRNAPSEPTPASIKKKDVFSASPSTTATGVSAGSFGGVERGGEVRSATAVLDILKRLRSHNARMRKLRKPHWSRTTGDALKKVAERAAGAGQEVQERRMDAFLKTLENGKPDSVSYLADNDLLAADHPWRIEGMRTFIKSVFPIDVVPYASKFSKEIHPTLVKAKKPGMQTFSGGRSIGGGKKLTVDGPGIRNAIAKGALIDDAGHIRCPIGTPGAMQFTNWQLEGCGQPNPKRLMRAAYEVVGDADLSEFLAAGGRRITDAEVAKGLAAAQRTAVTTNVDMEVARRQRVAERLREGTNVVGDVKRVGRTKAGKAKVEKVGKESRLSALLRAGRDSKSKRVTIDLTTGDEIGAGIVVPRSEKGLVLDVNSLFGELGEVNDDEAARVVNWLDSVIDMSPENGAEKVAVTLTRIDPPSRPYKPNTPPIKGRAQELADQANGDTKEFLRLLDSEGYVVFDFETSGFGAYGNVPVSVSAIRYKDGKEVDRKTIFMNPGREISPWSQANLTNSNGEPLTNEWLAEQIPLDEGMKEITDFMGDSILVAHNLDFDIDLLDRYSERAGIEKKYTGTLDTLQLARDILPKSIQPKHDLDALKKRYKIKSGKWHTADGDSEGANGILRGILNHGSGDSPFDVLDATAQQRRYDEAMQKYEAESAKVKKAIEQHKEVWGTDRKIIRVDVADVFPEGGTSQRSQKAALEKARDVADSRGESSILRLTDGSVLELGRAPRTDSVTVEAPDQTTARMFNAKTEIDAAFSRLEARDNMNIDSFTQDQIKAMMGDIRTIPGFEWLDPSNPDHLYLAIAQGADRLTQLLDAATPDERNKWRMWYDGASKYAKDLSDKYGISHESAVAVIAVLSPTTDWDANIALAEHAIKLATDRDFTIDQEMATSLILKLNDSRAKKISKLRSNIRDNQTAISALNDELTVLASSSVPGTRKREQDVREEIDALSEANVKMTAEMDSLPIYREADVLGKKMAELDDFVAKKVFAIHARSRGRSYIGQTYNGDMNADKATTDALLSYKMSVLSPDEYEIESSPNLARVQSENNYLKVLKILASDKNQTADKKVIAKELGRGSKVRSFYNNILNPKDTKYGDVTSDTHNFGAVTGVPVSAAHNILDVMFNDRTAQGAGRSYPIFRAMAVLAASQWFERTGERLLPREVQSITWEKIRQMVPTEYRNLAGKMVKDASLKSYVTDVMASIAKITGGPDGVPRNSPIPPKLKAFRREYAGREMELLSDLSGYLQQFPKGAARQQALKAWLQKYGLPEVTDKDRLSKAVKVKKDGTIVEVDMETGAQIDPKTGQVIAFEEIDDE